MGQSFCKNSLISVKAALDLRKKSDWFLCKKISPNLKYLNFKCEQGEYIFSSDQMGLTNLCMSIAKILSAIGVRCQWKSGSK